MPEPPKETIKEVTPPKNPEYSLEPSKDHKAETHFDFTPVCAIRTMPRRGRRRAAAQAQKKLANTPDKRRTAASRGGGNWQRGEQPGARPFRRHDHRTEGSGRRRGALCQFLASSEERLPASLDCAGRHYR